jgi:hypothetical protein
MIIVNDNSDQNQKDVEEKSKVSKNRAIFKEEVLRKKTNV